MKFGSRVQVKKARFWQRYMHRFQGLEGVVIASEIGRYSGVEIVTILFDESLAVFSADQLEIVSS